MSSWAFIVLELKNVRNAANKKIFFNVNVKKKLKRVNRFLMATSLVIKASK
jgi:hypothetical protein